MLDGPAYTKAWKRIQSRNAVVGVFGLGATGLELARAAADKGTLRVIGFDVDARRVKMLAEGRSYLEHVPSEAIAKLVETEHLVPTADFARAKEIDVAIICVQTPLGPFGGPDLSFIVQAANTIASHSRPGQLVILQSTTFPGTTRETLAPIFMKRGLTPGRDIFLAFSPERLDPGNNEYNTSNTPKVVGADDPTSLELASNFFSIFVDEVIPVSSSDTAEAVKLTENIFRQINVSLVNELKILYTAMGVDIWEVIAAAQTKPFGYMPFYPGPGIGGHCIPVDPPYLAWKAREFGLPARFIELADEINIGMPNYVISRLAEAIGMQCSRGLKGTSILIAGVAYKKNVNDYRESPALPLIRILKRRGAKAAYYDPFISEIPQEDGSPLRSISWSPQAISEFHAVLIATDHDGVNYRALVENSRLVVDTRNVCERHGLSGAHIVKA